MCALTWRGRGLQIQAVLDNIVRYSRVFLQLQGFQGFVLPTQRAAGTLTEFSSDRQISGH